MKRADIEAYTGVGKPPYCEMTLRAAMPIGSTPPDLTLPVTLTGVKQPSTITLERVAETADGVLRSPHTPLAKSPGNYKCYFVMIIPWCMCWKITVLALCVILSHVVPEVVYVPTN